MSKTAIIFGATGLTGGLLTELLIKDETFSKIKLISRRATGFEHPKVEDIICNVLALETIKSQFTGDVVFCCIGTTKAKTPDRVLYYKIDHGIPTAAARLAKENNIPTFMVVSSVGTSTKSPFFYVRTKGEMEKDVLEIGVQNTYIMKPAFINGRPDEDRKGEKGLKTIMAVSDFLMVGPLKKYRSVMASDIAKAMAYLATSHLNHNDIMNQEIKTLSAQYES